MKADYSAEDLAMFDEDQIGLDEKKLPTINEQGNRALEIMAELEAMKAVTVELNKELNSILFSKLPDSMREARATEITMENGFKLKLTEDVAGTLPKDPVAKKAAIELIMKDGDPNIVKHSVTAQFGLKQAEQAKSTLALLRNAGVNAVDDVSIHAGSLKKWAREWLSSENPKEQKFILDNLEKFGLSIASFVKISAPKK